MSTRADRWVSTERPLVVLLAGASGCGKSTLAAHVARELNFLTCLSTDTVRHVLRQRVSKQECPVLFASTYETGNVLPGTLGSPRERCIQGYQEQCRCLLPALRALLKYAVEERHESILVEGVHLTAEVMCDIIDTIAHAAQVICCMVVLRNKDAHAERLLTRGRRSASFPHQPNSTNKYLANIAHIREIQNFLLENSAVILLPLPGEPVLSSKANLAMAKNNTGSEVREFEIFTVDNIDLEVSTTLLCAKIKNLRKAS